MKKISSLLVVLASLLFCSTVSATDDRVVFENGDLVVYAPPAPPEEIQRYPKPFDSSVSPGEIPPEIALQLLNREIKHYSPENNTSTELLKILFWHIPLQYKINNFEWRFQLNENGKIARVQSFLTETRTVTWMVDFFYRILLLALILATIFFSKSAFSAGEIFTHLGAIVLFILLTTIATEKSVDNGLFGLFIVFITVIGITLMPWRLKILFLSPLLIYPSISLTVAMYGWKNSAITEFTGLIVFTTVISFWIRHAYTKMSTKK